MLRSQTVLTIHNLHVEGKTVQEIAQDLSISRTTVRKYLKHSEAVIRTPRPPRPSKLDPFKEQITKWVTEDQCTNCEVIFSRLRALGYTGGISILKELVHPLRPAVAGHASAQRSFPRGSAGKTARGPQTTTLGVRPGSAGHRGFLRSWPIPPSSLAPSIRQVRTLQREKLITRKEMEPPWQLHSAPSIRDGGAVAHYHHRCLHQGDRLLAGTCALGHDRACADYDSAARLDDLAPCHKTDTRRRIEQIDLEFYGQHADARWHHAERSVAVGRINHRRDDACMDKAVLLGQLLPKWQDHLRHAGFHSCHLDAQQCHGLLAFKAGARMRRVVGVLWCHHVFVLVHCSFSQKMRSFSHGQFLCLCL